jgi:hypothetical protein
MAESQELASRGATLDLNEYPMTTNHIIYRLDDLNPTHRAFAWGTFQGLRDRLSEKKRQRIVRYESGLRGTRNSARTRGWTDANCRTIATASIALLTDRYPNWHKCQGKRLAGSHGSGGISALRLEACATVKALKDPNAAKGYIRRGLNLLAARGNTDAHELLSKPWF